MTGASSNVLVELENVFRSVCFLLLLLLYDDDVQCSCFIYRVYEFTYFYLFCLYLLFKSLGQFLFNAITTKFMLKYTILQFDFIQIICIVFVFLFPWCWITMFPYLFF